jgi:hypothetical protein
MTKDHETEPDDLVERLEDSKGWPNLGKAAAARIRLDAEVIKTAVALAEALTREREMPCQDIDMQLREIQAVDEALAAFRQAQQARDEKGGE